MATYSGKDLIKQMENYTPSPGTLAIWSLGQMGFAIKGGDSRIIYIDPVLTDIVALKNPEDAEHFKRAFSPPLQPEDINNADYVFCTHEHLDHTDPLTLAGIVHNSPSAQIIAPNRVRPLLLDIGLGANQFIAADFIAPMDLDGIRVWIIPAAHYDLEYDEHSGYRYVGYLIQWDNVTLYHSGDTIVYPGYVEKFTHLPEVDVAILAMNGRDAYRESFGVYGNLMPVEVAWLAKTLGWDVVIHGHNDLFEWNTISASAVAEAFHSTNPRQKHHALQPGELYLYI